jgi:hypothetical protein
MSSLAGVVFRPLQNLSTVRDAAATAAPVRF